MIEITLTAEQWRHAAMIGCQRQIDGIVNNRASRDTRDRNLAQGWYWNINGASGEKVVSVWSGVPWDGNFGDFGAADVGKIEVRTTPGHDYPLRLHPHDKPQGIYLLVTGTGPSWRIQGWLKGADGMREELFHDRPPPVGKSTGMPAFWVPQSDLHTNLEEFKERWLAGLK